MNKYYENLHPEIKEYFKILSKEFPEWLFDYINTKEMQRIGKISMHCGVEYSGIFDVKYPYSNLDHSVGVALIIWNFTHDKKQTLAGLFHDIATPVFKHCIDFMNGDSETQESTEEKTAQIITNSEEIMNLLNRDNISVEDVIDYKLYPIADNDSPKLSADRFEYNFSSGLSFHPIWTLDKIREVYENIEIGTNEEGIDELMFRDQSICEKYIETVSKLWPKWICNEDKLVMQFIADICKSMKNSGLLTIDDLYQLTEEEMLNKVLNCPDKYIAESFKKFQQAKKAYTCSYLLNDKYCVKVKSKVRYLIPLVKTNENCKRITSVSNKTHTIIKNFLTKGFEEPVYTYFDFEFKPYEEPVVLTKTFTH